MEKLWRDLVTYIRRDLVQVIFHVTYRCNAQCNFCLNASKLNRNVTAEMDLAEIEKMARGMPSFPWLLISGGEPFLRKDLGEIVSIFYRLNRIRLLSLPTNGLIPEAVCKVTSEILDRCPGLTVNLVLSLDGVGQAHDQMRGVKGAFEKVQETFSLLNGIKGHAHRLSIKVETVVSRDNYRNLAEIIQFVRSLAPDRHVCDLARGDLSDPYKYLPQLAEIDETLAHIRGLEALYNGPGNLDVRAIPVRYLYSAVNNAYWKTTRRTLKEDRRLIPCYAGKVSAVVYPNSDVSFCELLPPIGSLREAQFSFSDLWNTRKAHHVRRDISRGFCHCFHPCNQLLNILCNPVQLMKALADKDTLYSESNK